MFGKFFLLSVGLDSTAKALIDAIEQKLTDAHFEFTDEPLQNQLHLMAFSNANLPPIYVIEKRSCCLLSVRKGPSCYLKVDSSIPKVQEFLQLSGYKVSSKISVDGNCFRSGIFTIHVAAVAPQHLLPKAVMVCIMHDAVSFSGKLVDSLWREIAPNSPILAEGEGTKQNLLEAMLPFCV